MNILFHHKRKTKRPQNLHLCVVFQCVYQARVGSTHVSNKAPFQNMKSILSVTEFHNFIQVHTYLVKQTSSRSFIHFLFNLITNAPLSAHLYLSALIKTSVPITQHKQQQQKTV